MSVSPDTSNSPALCIAQPKSTSCNSKSTGAKPSTLFPIARISRIIKADADVDICSKEATLLISIATEIFIRRFTDQAYTNAKQDQRKHVFYKDLSRAVQQSEWLEFLKQVVPNSISLSTALEKRADRFQLKERETEMILEGNMVDEDDQEQDQDQDQEQEQEQEQEEEEEEDQDEEQGDQVANDEEEAIDKSNKPAVKPKHVASHDRDHHDNDMDQDTALPSSLTKNDG
ncbi:uncharacterized protein MEPE_03403 [Melanopsichium pennsylvanicum]|uniref:Transcription factor CBF/NF-Y/archaeal histone domain-containing protein n=1 Tax=Melanopsichium pennsylvanicum TaxID=63383 RepID=A0AAJ4XLS1_9BASI|nr:uncharacterized protein MEPE_03403 [Melanopsichium pennsylvanicum]